MSLAAATGPSVIAFLAVAAGGAAGATLRFAMVTLAATWLPSFPLGTLIVNVLGCCIAGFVFPLVAGGSAAYALLIVGFCGGFTTMSAFGLDVWWLLDAGEYGRAALYLVTTLLLGIAGVVAGLEFSRLLLRH